MRQITPFLRYGLLRPQSEIGSQHFIRLTRNCFANTVGQESDRGKRADRERYGSQQYEYFA
jgi:hypothetical protein